MQQGINWWRQYVSTYRVIVLVLKELLFAWSLWNFKCEIIYIAIVSFTSAFLRNDKFLQISRGLVHPTLLLSVPLSPTLLEHLVNLVWCPLTLFSARFSMLPAFEYSPNGWRWQKNKRRHSLSLRTLTSQIYHAH